MKRTGLIPTLGACALLALGTPAQAQDSLPSPKEFIAQASATGTAKLEAAKAALRTSRSEDVRDFAQQVIDDHGKADSDLKSLARDKRLPEPEAAAAMEAEVPTSNLQEGREDGFDATYAREQVAVSEQAVDLFAVTADQEPDPDIQGFARNNLPVLKRHLQMARELEKAHPTE